MTDKEVEEKRERAEAASDADFYAQDNVKTWDVMAGNVEFAACAFESDATLFANARRDVIALSDEVYRLKNVLRFINQLSPSQENWWDACLNYVKHALGEDAIKV